MVRGPTHRFLERKKNVSKSITFPNYIKLSHTHYLFHIKRLCSEQLFNEVSDRLPAHLLVSKQQEIRASTYTTSRRQHHCGEWTARKLYQVD
jgi:hypothetical protein